MVAVPYTFGNVTGTAPIQIPASQIDANFAYVLENSALISSVMEPVVGAPTLQDARTALGVGGGGGSGIGVNVVADFNADPTGATDSTTAFNNAKAAAVNNTFYVPAGNFMLTPTNGQVQNPSQAVLFNAGPCSIYMDPNARIFAAPGTYLYTSLFRLGAGVTLFGGIFDFGNGTGLMTGCWCVGGTAGSSGAAARFSIYQNSAYGLLQLLQVNDQITEGNTYTNAQYGYQGSGDRLTYKGNIANGNNTMRVGHQIQGGTTIEASSNKSHGVTEVGLQAIGTNLITNDNVTDQLITDNVKALWIGGFGTTPLGISAAGNIADFGNTAGGGGVLLEEGAQASIRGNITRGALGRVSYGIKCVAQAGLPLGNLRDYITVLDNVCSIPATNDVIFEGANFGQNINAQSGYALLNDGYAVKGSGTIIETTTARTLSNTDNGKTIITTNASAIAITVATGLLPGFSCSFFQKGTGQFTFATGSPGSRVISVTGLTSKEQNAGAVLQNYGAQDLYILTGDTVSLPSSATLSPTNKAAGANLSGANLTVTADVTATNSRAGIGTESVNSGAQIYFEATVNAVDAGNGLAVGVANIGIIGHLTPGFYLGLSNSFACYNDGSVLANNGLIATISSFAAADVVGIAVKDNDKIWFRVNGGNWNNDPSADPSTNVGGIDITGLGSAYAAYNVVFNTTAGSVTYNFGGSSFAHAIPPGYTYLP